MNKESKIFQRILLKGIDLMEYNLYSFERIHVFNENTSNEYITISFLNKLLNKYLTFSFYPPNRAITNNEITVGLSELDKYGNWSSFDIPTFLAYKELNRIVCYEDKEKYRFKLNPENLEASINEQLQKIKNILNTDLNKILTTKEWISIPTHDPRDDY
ncbi:MAG: hypothetical protein WBP45_10805 [Daejeonella sp.]